MTQTQPGGVYLSVVAPVFNEEDNVVPLWHEIRQVLEPLGLPFEVIFVDDGSQDRSAERLAELCQADPRVKLARFTRNFGQTAALSAGFELAGGRIIVALDADRQNDPASIPVLLEELKKGYDVVSGWRMKRQDGALLRRLPSQLANRLIARVTGVRLHDYGCTLKAYKAEFIKDVRLYGQMHRFIPIYCAWQGARVGECVVNHRPRTAGKSKYGLGRTGRVLLDLAVVQFLHKYAGRPMHMFVRFAVAMLAAAAVLLAAGVGVSIWSRSVTTLLTTGALALTTGGLGVLAVLIGLVAELQWRTYFEARQQRPYVYRQLINFDASAAPVRGTEVRTDEARSPKLSTGP